MADFSIIASSDQLRAVVQDGILERMFHDALFPQLLFRADVEPVQFPGNIGDRMIFTGPGLITPKPRPIRPSTDPTPSSYTYEQWEATVQQYADSLDSHMPTSIVAAVNLFLRDGHQLGLAAGQTLNRVLRNRLYNAGMTGHTVATDPAGGSAAQTLTGTSGTLHVASINGLTTARRPDVSGASQIKFEAVSATNPLKITVQHTTGTVECSVVAVTPDTTGDEFGPGTLSLTYSTGPYTVNHRYYVLSYDRPFLHRVGGGNSVDALTASADVLALTDLRAMVARFRAMNVPTHADGTYHCHIDPIGESQLYDDTEFQRLLTSLPDSDIYQNFAIGKLLGCTFFRNSECPSASTVYTVSGAYSTDDPFAGELTNASGATIHRALFTGGGGCFEYYLDPSQMVTEAGVNGKIVEPRITNDGVQVAVDRVKLIIRAPQDRLQQLVSTSYSFIGDFPVRTDAATGDDARYKRVGVLEFTE